MVETHKALGQRQVIRRLGLAMLCLAWFSTAAESACLPHVQPDGAGSDRHEIIGHSGNTDHNDDACCILSDDARSQPALAHGGSPAKPKPAALPAQDIVRVLKAAPLASSVSLEVDSLFPSPPYYLLYNRLLIPAFS